MSNRMQEELRLLRAQFSDVEYIAAGHWVLIRNYLIPTTPAGWNRSKTDVAFQIPPSPGTAPYGFYVPVGIRFNGGLPGNYKEPAGNKPPFEGTWGMFSWSPDGDWVPAAEISAGCNMLNWAFGFAQRFRGAA